MGTLEKVLGILGDIVWGPPLLILIVGTGIYLTFRLGFLQVRMLPYSLKLAFSKKQDKNSEGDISHFKALMTAMAATVGVGNIVGVAGAVVVGGPGAIFWMWMSAFFGMATKYGEAILAVKYRVTDANGQMAGGPMYYIEKGLKLKWLAVLFAVFGSVAAFGIGNGTQAQAVAGVVSQTWNIPTWVTGLVLMIAAALVILGGIKSIGNVTAFFVPIMAVFYLLAGLIIIFTNLPQIPAALGLIFSDAFTGQAVAGGAIGTVIRYGVARGVFSNEAGLGSAPIAAAAAKTDMPGRQALVSMTQVFIDTILICSITGLTIVMSGLYDSGLKGSELTAAAFSEFLGGAGPIVVSVGLIFFATSTIFGWAYYGEKCFQYLFRNPKAIYIYRILFVLVVPIGATASLDIVWTFSDVANGMMAIPNLIGLLGLSGVIAFETKKILAKVKEEKNGVTSSEEAA